MPTVSPTPTLVNVDMDDVVPSAPKSPAPVPLDLAGQTISSCDDLEKGEHSAIDSPYSGAGTLDDPLVVRWLENDPQNPFVRPLRTGGLQLMMLSTRDQIQLEHEVEVPLGYGSFDIRSRGGVWI